uniref:Diacylglycerol kinase n=1 Tax=Monodelphis domestica TaxID=13616 RepID=A0A5F8GL32_MONDO
MLACHLCAFQKSVKEGFLLKQTSSFQRWKRRYVRIRGKTLYYAKDSKSLIFDEIDLTDASVAETSTKNVNNSFTVITPFRKLILCAENRKEMEDWISALKAVQKWAANEVRELRGKLPEAAACSGDQSPIDGINRKIMRWKRGPSVHTCRSGKRQTDQFSKKCPLGQYRVSILPPTVLNCMDSDGFWKASCPGSCSSPLLAFVNSKSGDNQGVRFLRKFKQFLNPAQVFDLMNGGPHLGLRLFQRFSTFRILVCGGDGSVGWVLSEIDTLGLHKQCQLGVLPLGTGNDLARVLGWGSLCDDDTQLLQILEKMERATTKMLDRYTAPSLISVPSGSSVPQLLFMRGHEQNQKGRWEGAKFTWQRLPSPGTDDFLASTRSRGASLHGHVSNRTDMLIRELEMEPQAAVGYLENTPLAAPSAEEEGDADDFEGGAVGGAPAEVCQPSSLVPPAFRSKDQMVLRANSLKKALKQVIEQAEQGKGSSPPGKARHLCSRIPTSSEAYLLELCSSLCQLGVFVSPQCSGLTLVVALKPFILRLSGMHMWSDPGRSLSEGSGSESSCPVGTLISILLSSSVDFSQFSEKCVMNNYFGIGLDAKISLEFNNKRDEHPKKCSSRTKNMMWYGVLGTKELLQRTYKNLEQRVQLECDGEIMALPSLQGIAVLNIPSYAGGINFWGGTKEDNNFGAPSFDDKKLEVVAVFGSIQMAVSRVINLQHHRIAQCRVVKITICGDEGVPVQVDGEAWVQPPGIIKIQHKNRAQMLTRDRAFESTLKSWEDKQKGESYRSARPRLNSQQSMEYLTEEEYRLLQRFARSADILITRIREVAKIHKAIEQELAHSVNSCASSLTEVLPSKRSGSSPEVRADGSKGAENGRGLGLGEGTHEHTHKHRPNGHLSFSFLLVDKWGPEEVASWLDALGLGEYKDIFTRHEIQGSELILLERRDLKDLGIRKVGHVKKILQGIKDISHNL